jgi:hypothetical protein
MMEESIKQAISELKTFNLPWKDMVQKQLEYCLEVVSGKSSPEQLEKLNIGLIAVRELEKSYALFDLLTEIQYEMQHKYLTYAAKVRLNIHKR